MFVLDFGISAVGIKEVKSLKSIKTQACLRRWLQEYVWAQQCPCHFRRATLSQDLPDAELLLELTSWWRRGGGGGVCKMLQLREFLLPAEQWTKTNGSAQLKFCRLS